jgi:paraquat-inducible protein B
MTDNEDKPAQVRRTEAVTERSHWPGWIWAVPIAAVGIAVWLLVRQLSSGIAVSVTFDDSAGMKANHTEVRYRGVKVGEVTEVALAADGSHVIAHLDIEDSMENNLRSGTQFYLEGARPSYSDPASLKAILAGPTIVMRPGAGKSARDFTGVIGSPPQSLAVAIPYLVEFEGPVGGLQAGAPVTFRGFTVGDVVSVRLTTDSQTGKVSAPIVLMLDPTRFHIEGAAGEDRDWAAIMNAMLAKLVVQGLRARLTRNLPLIGGRQVALEVIAGANQKELITGGRYPQIPAMEAGGIGSLVTELEDLPLGDVADNLRAITERLKVLISSPELQDSVASLDNVLAELDEVMQNVGPQVAPTVKSMHETVESLHKTAREIDAAAEAAKTITGTSPRAPEGNVQHALAELAEAARAVRSLADYLDQHPEALIRGR